jgi:hypothetical protein
MNATRADRLRHVRNKLELRGDRDRELVALLDDVLVELVREEQGGAAVLSSLHDCTRLELELQELAGALTPEHRRLFALYLLDVDGAGPVLDLIEERARRRATSPASSIIVCGRGR